MTGPYCSQCGEKKLSAQDYSLKTVVHEVAEDFAHLDSKILRTLIALLSQPGLLSKVYFAGGRSRYTKPLTLFVILNLAFFVVQPHTKLLSYNYMQYLSEASPGSERRKDLVRKKLIENRETEASYQVRFDSRLQEQKKSMLIISVPVLALGMLLLYFRRRRYFVEHLVFSIHVYAFLLISLTLLAGFLQVAHLSGHALGPSAASLSHKLDGEAGISAILGSALLLHILFGLRRAYSDSWLSGVLRAGAMTFTIMIFTGYYHDLLFYTAYFTT